MTRARWATVVVTFAVACGCSSVPESQIALPLVATTVRPALDGAGVGGGAVVAAGDAASGATASTAPPNATEDSVLDAPSPAEAGSNESTDPSTGGEQLSESSTPSTSEDGAGDESRAADDGGPSGGGTTAAADGPDATRPTRNVAGPDLVGDTTPLPDNCRPTSDDCPEPGATPCPICSPYRIVSIGEYQSLPIPDGYGVDVYFDQSRTYDDMDTRCFNARGDLEQRADDGSRWAGWWYCSIRADRVVRP